jgi:hypothetical protein
VAQGTRGLASNEMCFKRNDMCMSAGSEASDDDLNVGLRRTASCKLHPAALTDGGVPERGIGEPIALFLSPGCKADRCLQRLTSRD